MIFPGLASIHNDQKGFTLLELIIAIAIAGLITAGITVAIMQIMTINHRASNHMVAVRQVQQAGKEVSKDALQCQNVTCGADSGFPLTLNWTDWEGANYTVVYTFQTMPSSPDLMMLQRSQSINGTPQTPAPLTVAEHIDSEQTNCVWNATAGTLVFKVTARLGTEIETRIYEIEPRPGS